MPATVEPEIQFGRIYLDANATTRPFPEVVEVVAHHMRLNYGNPGSRHAEGRRARRILEASREQIAELLQAHPSEVVFTSGGTEASNMAVLGLTQTKVGRIATTAGEHPATLEACRALTQRGWQIETLPVNREGRIQLEGNWDLPWDEIRLVSVILAHNETGVIQDTSELKELCHRHQVPLHLDAVQAVGKMPIRFHELGAAALSLGAHKFHGPRGIGALLVREDVRLTPVSYGGHQEADRRPGTESVALIAGMARALELCHQDLSGRIAKLRQMRDQLEAGLLETCQPCVVNGSRNDRLPNTLNMSFPGADGEALLVALDLEGVACSLGSACASGSAEPAPALVAMGCPPEIYKSAVRFTVSVDNTPDEMIEAVRRISLIVDRLRNSLLRPR